MRVEKTICDKCKKVCQGERVVVTYYGDNEIKFSDYCLSCYERMLSGLKANESDLKEAENE